MSLSREITDPIYEKHWEPGFEWMSEEGFNKAVNVVLKEQLALVIAAGNEANDSFLKEVASNIFLKAQLDKAVELLDEVYHQKWNMRGIKAFLDKKGV